MLCLNVKNNNNDINIYRNHIKNLHRAMEDLTVNELKKKDKIK